jgi:hypothetical protein
MKERLYSLFVPLLACFLAGLVVMPAPARGGASMVLRFDELDAAGPGGGDWYKDDTNENGTLAWGESYVLMAYSAMYEATGERVYLDRLAEHTDGVLAHRDDVLGTADYTGSANPCWQATRYSDQPMCWAVHSGMLTYPMAMFAAHVAARDELASALTYDGTTYADKAASILDAVVETYEFHEPQWRDESASSGYYIFPSDATFYTYAGQEMPLNQMNAMGRTALALWLATGDEAYRTRAEKLAGHLRANLHVGSGDLYLWNYWGGSYSSPGEDISHAAISVGFAALCASLGVSFTDADMLRFGRTFFDSVIVDNLTSHDNVGGGSVNGDSYRPQMGRWAVLGAWDPRVTAAVRNYFQSMASVSSGSVLLGFAYLARYEYFIRPFVFYHVDWNDMGDRRQATAYGANVLTMPHDPAVPVFYRMTYEAQRSLVVDQWDGEAYHGVLKLAASAAPSTVVVAFDPRWWFLYTADGELFQFTDAFVSGQGVIVHEPEGCEPPAVDPAPADGELEEGALFSFDFSASGQEPMLWFLRQGPVDARLGRADGVLEWTADFSGGAETFTVEAHNDCGAQSVTWTLSPLVAEEPAEPAADAVEDEPHPDAPDAAVDAADIPVDGPVDVTTDAIDWTFDLDVDGSPGPGDTGDCGCFMAF